ncbi:hypothetical protein ANTRET_LOCUS6726 [Anthophora retusa]
MGRNRQEAVNDVTSVIRYDEELCSTLSFEQRFNEATPFHREQLFEKKGGNVTVSTIAFEKAQGRGKMKLTKKTLVHLQTEYTVRDLVRLRKTVSRGLM